MGILLAIHRLTLYNEPMSQRSMHEPTFLILTALAAGPQHGYGIMTDVRDISGGRVKLGAGTLYAALDRLRTDQLVDVDREEIVDTRLRRYYRLTPAGAERLAVEADRLRANAAVATKRLKLAGGTA
jgi:DNA-binding PadR family transcriptional regulator